VDQPFRRPVWSEDDEQVVAGSTQWGTHHIAAIEKFVVSANVGFLAQGPTHPIGHQPPVAVTSKFLVPGGIEWLVFGDQVDRENFRTRP
jgi:hypothetical protein